MTWRSPALAPVYALLTAFVVVVAIGVFTGQASTATVLWIDAGDRPERTELANSQVDVHRPGEEPVTGRLSADLTYEMPDSATGGQLCLRLPPQWRVTEPAMANGCTARPLGTDLRFAVVRNGRVTVTFLGQQPEQGTSVTLQRQDDPAYSETGPLDGSGHYQPRGSLAGQTVCVQPPFGWTVQTPPTDGTRCTTGQIADPAKDVGIVLVKSPDGGPR